MSEQFSPDRDEEAQWKDRIEFAKAQVEAEEAFGALGFKKGDTVKVTGKFEAEGTIVKVSAFEPHNEKNKDFYVNIDLNKELGKDGSTNQLVPLSMIEDKSVQMKKLE